MVISVSRGGPGALLRPRNLGVVAFALASVPLLAQEADESGGLQEVVVTAQFRSQPLQDTLSPSPPSRQT